MSARSSAEGLVRAGEVPKFWWVNTEIQWYLPAFSETGLLGAEFINEDYVNWLAAREQLWAIRENLA